MNRKEELGIIQVSSQVFGCAVDESVKRNNDPGLSSSTFQCEQLLNPLSPLIAKVT